MLGNATGRTLHDPRGGSFWFDAGAVCLDFAHSGGEGVYAQFETLRTPADLASWFAGPPPVAVLTVPPTARDLAAAKTLRQAIWEAAHARADDAPLPAHAVATINAAAAEPALAPEITPAGFAAWRTPVTAPQALSALARETVHLLTGPLAHRIRECAGDPCPLVFADASRPGTRRWCSMDRCGNRAKLRAHRARNTS